MCRDAGIPVEQRAGNVWTGPQRKLTIYWTTGEGAAKIGGWGHAGDFAACVAHLRDKVRDPEGLCATYHRIATGFMPGHAPGEKAGHG